MDNVKKQLDYIKVSSYRKKLSIEESEAFMAELTGVAIFGGKSILIEFLINDDFDGFKKHIAHMNREGNLIKSALKNCT